MANNLVTESFSFRYGTRHKRKLIKFSISHNLHDFGLDLYAAFTNWSVRCDDPTNQADFIEYIKSKDPLNIIAHANQ